MKEKKDGGIRKILTEWVGWRVKFCPESELIWCNLHSLTFFVIPSGYFTSSHPPLLCKPHTLFFFSSPHRTSLDLTCIQTRARV